MAKNPVITPLKAAIPKETKMQAISIPALASGGLTDDTAFTDDIILRRVKNLEVESAKEITLDLDGMSLTDKHFTIRLIPDAVRLIVPSQG